MEIPIIKIGNSKGIRLSKTILEKYNITDKVTLVMDKDQIRLVPVAQPRAGSTMSLTMRILTNGNKTVSHCIGKFRSHPRK
jgi:antitoxin component of MazEF toxin-antitoxin module